MCIFTKNPQKSRKYTKANTALYLSQHYIQNTQLTIEQHRFQVHGSIYTWIFSINTQWAPLIPGFHMHVFNQLGIENSLFNPRLGNDKTNCMHCSTPFYIKTCASTGWYPWGSWDQSPKGIKGQLKFSGSPKLYRIFDCERLAPLAPVLFKGKLCIIFCTSQIFLKPNRSSVVTLPIQIYFLFYPHNSPF